MASRHITYYTSDTGASPVTEFVDGLDDRAQAEVINSIHLLKEFGVQLGGAHTKKLAGTDVWELRILGNDSVRVIYLAVEQQTFLLLHGFKKKSFKTPTKELKVALDRLRDYRAHR